MNAIANITLPSTRTVANISTELAAALAGLRTGKIDRLLAAEAAAKTERDAARQRMHDIGGRYFGARPGDPDAATQSAYLAACDAHTAATSVAHESSRAARAALVSAQPAVNAAIGPVLGHIAVEALGLLDRLESLIAPASEAASTLI